jgi:hypothetical protein
MSATRQINMLRLLADLSPAQWKVFCVLMLIGRRVTEMEIIRYSKLSKGTVVAALQALCDPLYGLAFRVKSGWVLANQPMLETQENGEIDDKSINFILSPIININQNHLTEIETVNNNSAKSTKFELFYNSLSDEKKATWDALRAAGIGYNFRTAALLDLEHITPEYITAKKKQISRACDVGALIEALEQNIPADDAQIENSTSWSSYSIDFGQSSEPESDGEREERINARLSQLSRLREVIAEARANGWDDVVIKRTDAAETIIHFLQMDGVNVTLESLEE